jgi:serine/threonine-protein phosphatase 6 regulatory ankyrin repeat subunit B
MDFERQLIRSYFNNEKSQILSLLQQHRNDISDNTLIDVLFTATSEGNNEVINMLLDYDVDVNSTNKNLATPLHFAASKDRSDTVDLLIQRGANINSLDELHYTPLMYTIRMNSFNAFRQLLFHGADVNIPTIFGITPLMEAVKRNRVTFVEQLINFNVNINTPNRNGIHVLWDAVENNQFEIVKLLIRGGIDINQPYPFDNSSILRKANSPEMIKILVDGGVNLNHRDNNGKTPLFSIIFLFDVETILYLLERGADVKGTTILDYYIKFRPIDTNKVRLLLEYGANRSQIFYDQLNLLPINQVEQIIDEFDDVIEIMSTYSNHRELFMLRDGRLPHPFLFMLLRT